LPGWGRVRRIILCYAKDGGPKDIPLKDFFIGIKLYGVKSPSIPSFAGGVLMAFSISDFISAFILPGKMVRAIIAAPFLGTFISLFALQFFYPCSPAESSTKKLFAGLILLTLDNIGVTFLSAVDFSI
jgi:hypothetical protein